MSVFQKVFSPRNTPTGPVTWCICCLGNPGPKYEGTRHNAGFMTADVLAEKVGCKLNKLKFKAVCGEFEHAGQRVLLLKPQTYMNSSGESVGEAARWYKLKPDHVIVVCDDLELPCGRLRVRAKGSDGGHNGLKSIIYHLNSNEFPRVKIGIDRPKEPGYEVVDYVLGRFPEAERPTVDKVIHYAADAALEIIAHSPELAASHYNGLKA